MEKNNVIFLRSVTEKMLENIEKTKSRKSIKTTTGAVSYILENYEDVYTRLISAQKEISELEKKYKDLQYKLSDIKSTWQDLTKLLK
jgi:chromosome segregation ATPase